MASASHVIRIELPSSFELLDLVQVLSDRLSALEQWDLPFTDAIANEARRGREVINSGETSFLTYS